MCGVFGFIGRGERRPNLARLRDIARVTQRRGGHAFGFAWIDGRGRLRAFKQTGRIGDHLGTLAMAADATMLIGHCRYATQGDPADNLNNHPHASDGGWIVHNGMIPQHRELMKAYGMSPVTDCDSELLALLIEESCGDLPARFEAAVRGIDRAAPTVVVGLWPRPARMVLLRRGNPLHAGRAAEGLYFGSLADELPGRVGAVADGTVVMFRRDRAGGVHVQKRKLAPDVGASEVRSGGAVRNCSAATDACAACGAEVSRGWAWGH